MDAHDGNTSSENSRGDGRLPVASQESVRPCIIATVICILVSLFDMYTDIAQSIIHFSNDKRWWGHLTLAAVVAPAFINSVYTAVTCYVNESKIVLGVKFPYPKLVYFLCLCLHGHLARLIIWIYGLRTKAINNNLAKEMVLTNRDMSFYLEVFLESIPQMYLQFYIMIVRWGDITASSLVTVGASFLAASWGVLLLYDSKMSKIFAFQMNAFWMTSRILSLAVFSSVKRWAPFILVLVHLVSVLPLWFYEIKKQPFETRGNNRRGFCHTLVSDLFYAILYAVCNTATPMVSAYYLPLSIIFFIENVGCFWSVYYHGILDNRYVDDENGTMGAVRFQDWRFKVLFVSAICAVTAIAFIQSSILFVLKNRKMITENFMTSNIIKVIQKVQPVNPLKRTQSMIRGKFQKEITGQQQRDLHTAKGDHSKSTYALNSTIL